LIYDFAESGLLARGGLYRP